eukprot:205630_1
MSARYRKMLQMLLDRKTIANRPLKLDIPKHISHLFNDPFNNYKIVHVAGTNGKGSVCTKLSEVLKVCGYKTGLTLSPHTSCVRERIQINNEMISENDFCDGVEQILEYETPQTELSFFELITILSFNHFAKKYVDYAVIEVGLGGRFDATNIITNPSLSVITSISLDHTAILGETVEEITKEKAGIIKPKCPIVIGPTVNRNVIDNLVENKHLLHISDNNENISFDEENIIITRKCIDILKQNDESFRLILPKIDISNSLLKKPNCRFELIEFKSMKCIMDCAHNLDAMQKLFDLLQLKYDQTIYDYRVIIGMSKGKNVAECLTVVNKYAKYIHFVSVSNLNKRSLTIQELEACYLENIDENHSKMIPNSLDANCKEIIGNALNQCVRNNEQNENKQQILIVCGSLYIMSETRKIFDCNDVVDDVDFSDLEFGQRKI